MTELRLNSRIEPGVIADSGRGRKGSAAALKEQEIAAQ